MSKKQDFPVNTRPSRCPTHPGALLREEVLPALGLNVSEAARLLGISRQTLHRVLAEQAAISPEMALRLGRLAGNGPNLWLGMQSAHDLWQAEQRIGPALQAIPTPPQGRLIRRLVACEM